MIKVLVIDPDSDFASLLETEIRNHGHETLVVSAASEATASTSTFAPDLVLVDIDDLEIPASELIGELKQSNVQRIVACGSTGSLDDIKAAVVAGASDYVQKNAGAAAIVDRILPSEITQDAADLPLGSQEFDDEEDNDGEAPAVQSPKPRVVVPRAPVKEGTRPFCVVVAHPDEQKRQIITETIEKINEALHVIEVATSQEAIEACAENRTVMLVIDWDMPDMPARNVMRTVKESETGRATAMFVTYKSNSPEKQRLAEHHGALAFANEPWDDFSLEAKLKHALEVIRKRRRKAKMQALKAKAS